MQTLGDGVPEADPPSYLRGLLEDEVARAEHLLEAAALHDAQQQTLLLEDDPQAGAAAAAVVPARGAGSLAHAAAAAALSKSSQRVDSLFLAVRDDSDGKGGGAGATAEARIHSVSVRRLIGQVPFGVPIVGLSSRTTSGAIDAATATIDNELSEVLSGAFDAAAAAPSGITAVSSLLDAPGDGGDEGGAADTCGAPGGSASDAEEDNNYGDEVADFGERHSGDEAAIREGDAVSRRASGPAVDTDSGGAAVSAGLAQVATLGAAGTALALTAAAIAAGVPPSQLASAAKEVDLTPLTEEAMQKETVRMLLSHNWGSGTAALRRIREMRYLKVCDTPSSAPVAARESCFHSIPVQVREALALVKSRQVTQSGAAGASQASAPPAAAEEEAEEDGAGADPESGGEDGASEASGVQRRQSHRLAGAKRGRGPPAAELVASAGEAAGDISAPVPSVADDRTGLRAIPPVRKRVKGRGRRARQVASVYEQLASSLAADLVGREARGGAAEAAADAPIGGGGGSSQADESVLALRLLTDRRRARGAAVASLGSVAASAPGPASFAATLPSEVGDGGGGSGVPFVVQGWGAGFDAGRPAPAIVEAANRDFLAPSARQSRMPPSSQGGGAGTAAAAAALHPGDEVETFSDSDGDDKSGLLLPKPEAEKRAALWQSLHGKYVLQRATAREETARKRSEAAAATSAAAAEPTQQDLLGGDANEVSSVADGDLADGDGWGAAGPRAEQEDDDELSVADAAPPPPDNRHEEARKGSQKGGQGAGASADVVPLSRSRVLAAASASAAAASAAAPAVLGAASSGRRTGGARLLVPLQFIPAAAPPPAPVAPSEAAASVRGEGDAPAAKRSIRLPGHAGVSAGRAPIALPRGAAVAPAAAASTEFADADEYADEFVAEAAGTGARDDYEMDVDNSEY